MATAFVLILVKKGSEGKVMSALKGIPEVKEANLIHGVYDIIARLEAGEMEGIKDTLNWRIRRLEGVRTTTTLIEAQYPRAQYSRGL